MPLPRPLRRFRRRTLARAGWALAAVVTVGAIGANGLHNIGTAESAVADGCRPATASAQPSPPELPDVQAAQLTAPRTITGPATAITQSGRFLPSPTPHHRCRCCRRR